MKQVVLFTNNFSSNPSYLGADKLWADDSGVVGEIIALKDYDGI